MRFLIKNGDMIMDNRDNSVWIAIGDEFTKRYLDADDHEMIAHGMGEYAGSYESAIKVVNTTTGELRHQRMRTWRRHIKNLTAEHEETINSAGRKEERGLTQSACTTL
jgi:predicted RNA-binding protein